MFREEVRDIAVGMLLAIVCVGTMVMAAVLVGVFGLPDWAQILIPLAVSVSSVVIASYILHRRWLRTFKDES